MDIGLHLSSLLVIVVMINSALIVESQFYLPRECFFTFGNASVVLNPSYPNSSVLICPSSCYTTNYVLNQQAYPLFGNETYSANSLVCKAALHDGRVAPWLGENSPVRIVNSSVQTAIFVNALRNGILSGKSTSTISFGYTFGNNRINESRLPDVAIEHRRYLYSQNESSSITCRSKGDVSSIRAIDPDAGWKRWTKNRLNYFTVPWMMTRDNALSFCMKNNGTLMYWSNSTEQSILENVLTTTIYQLFRYQRSQNNNDTLSFFVGLKQINQIQQWESNPIGISEVPIINFGSMDRTQDYCTLIQISSQSILYSSHLCNDSVMRYPLCRLLPSVNNNYDLIYRLESDNQAGTLSGVIDYCAELGGYPIYAYSAYEWQIIQEMMLLDPSFNDDYVYTGLIAPEKVETDAFWMPTNVSYNSSLGFIRFAPSRGSDRTGYHLSRSRIESYYYLYDINPSSTLNRLRFCRKPDPRSVMQSVSCQYASCSSQCLNTSLSSQSDDVRFGLFACLPKSSLAGIVYTQSIPRDGDFIRPDLPMSYSVSVRRTANQSLSLSFRQTNSLTYPCFQYNNLDNTGTLDDTLQLNCDQNNVMNKTMSGILLKPRWDGLISLSLQQRRLSGHHFRFIDNNDSGSLCSYQGISHPSIPQCICAPGFYGTQCQYNCPAGYYGQDCSFHCAGDDNYCRGLLICLPDPYGCSCYTGWYGTRCNLSCPSNFYGPDCSYQCTCSNCDRFTGVCGCEGTECYRGLYSRSELESRCSSSTNLALLIAVPLASVFVLILIVVGVLIWRWRRNRDEQTLVNGSGGSPMASSNLSRRRANDAYTDYYNNILTERL